MKNGRLQLKDIPDRPILEFLLRLERGEIASTYESQCSESADGIVTWYPSSGVAWGGTAHGVPNAMPLGPATPARMVLAKMQRLINRGLVSGCACGCRGDFELTDEGRASTRRPLGVERAPRPGAASVEAMYIAYEREADAAARDIRDGRRPAIEAFDPLQDFMDHGCIETANLAEAIEAAWRLERVAAAALAVALTAMTLYQRRQVRRLRHQWLRAAGIPPLLSIPSGQIYGPDR